MPENTDNLLVAGRCVSATHEALGAIRIMPAVFAMGQAAGTAGAMCVKNSCRPAELDTKALQLVLKEQGQEFLL